MLIIILRIPILLFFLFISGCKKYEEGNFFEFSSTSKRISGTWEIEYLYVQGIDSTIYATKQLCNAKVEFVVREDDKKSGLILPVDTVQCKNFYGHWYLFDRKRSLRLAVNHLPGSTYVPVGSYLGNGLIDWDINKLTKDQLWLNTNQMVTMGSGVGIHSTWIHLKKVD